MIALQSRVRPIQSRDIAAQSRVTSIDDPTPRLPYPSNRWFQRATTIATTVVKDPPTFKVSTFRAPST